MADDEEAPIAGDPAGVSSVGKPIPGSNRPTRGQLLEDYSTAEQFAAKGREASGWTREGRMIMTRFASEDGVPVPGDDPLYVMLGTQRLFAEDLARKSTEGLVRLDKQMDELNVKAHEKLDAVIASLSDHIGQQMDQWRASIAAEMGKWSEELGEDSDKRVGALLASVDAAVAVQRQRERDAAPAAFSAAVAPTMAKLAALAPGGSKPGWLLNTINRDRIAELALFAAIVAGVMSLLSFYLIAHTLGRL